MKLRKGDPIIVIRGKDKGRKGKIEKVFPKTSRVIIPGINVYKKHTRKQSERKPGGIIEIVKPLAIANVALVCPKCKKPTRVGYQVSKGSKTRVCRKCQTLI